jgi:hypothetical protein
MGKGEGKGAMALVDGVVDERSDRARVEDSIDLFKSALAGALGHVSTKKELHENMALQQEAFQERLDDIERNMLSLDTIRRLLNESELRIKEEYAEYAAAPAARAPSPDSMPESSDHSSSLEEMALTLTGNVQALQDESNRHAELLKSHEALLHEHAQRLDSQPEPTVVAPDDGNEERAVDFAMLTTMQTLKQQVNQCVVKLGALPGYDERLTKVEQTVKNTRLQMQENKLQLGANMTELTKKVDAMRAGPSKSEGKEETEVDLTGLPKLIKKCEQLSAEIDILHTVTRDQRGEVGRLRTDADTSREEAALRGRQVDAALHELTSSISSMSSLVASDVKPFTGHLRALPETIKQFGERLEEMAKWQEHQATLLQTKLRGKADTSAVAPMQKALVLLRDMLFDPGHSTCAGARAQYRCISCDKLQSQMGVSGSSLFYSLCFVSFTPPLSPVPMAIARTECRTVAGVAGDWQVFCGCRHCQYGEDLQAPTAGAGT